MLKGIFEKALLPVIMTRDVVVNTKTSLTNFIWPPPKHIHVDPEEDLEYFSYLDYTRPYLWPTKGRKRHFDKWIIVMHNSRKIAHIDYGPETGQIGFMHVADEYQKNGIMSRLFEHALNDMREYTPEHCWAVTNTEPDSGPFKLFSKFGGEYSDPANESCTGDGLRFKIDYGKEYRILPNIVMMPDMKKGEEDHRNHLGFGMTFEEAKEKYEKEKMAFEDTVKRLYK